MALVRACRWLVLVAVGLSLSAAAAPGYRVAVFESVVTIPVGHACMGGGIADAKEIIDPLFAKGFVLLGAGEPVVVVAVDYCQLNNGAYDRWRAVLAEAAGTTPVRVLLATVHQHDAPICDDRAQALLDANGLPHSMCDVAVYEKAAQRTAAALKAAMSNPRPVTHVGVGQAKVERIASNRRVAAAGQKVHWNRTSADKKYDAEPEGLIDPMLKTISLWDGDRPVLAWSCYAVHPMSYYGKGQVSADFVGRARARREADDLSVAQIYFSGCAGDTTAGKYNDGTPEDRAALAERLYEGMVGAWKDTKRTPLDQVSFRAAAVRLGAREGGDFDPAVQPKILADARVGRWRRNTAAMGLAWRERLAADRPIDVPCLDLGAAQFMVMPAETFVGYQLAAQKMRADSFVMVSGYGDGAPGYIPTDACWAEGYDDSYCWVKPNSDAVMNAAMAEALRATGR